MHPPDIVEEPSLSQTCSEHLHQLTVRQIHLPQSYFRMKCWISHVLYWILYGKWQTESLCWLFTLWSRTWLTGSHRCPASWDSTACLTSFVRPGKDQNSQFKVHFPLNAYYFHTILTLQNREVEPSLSQTPCAYSKVLQPVTKLSLNWVFSKTLANLLA